MRIGNKMETATCDSARHYGPKVDETIIDMLCACRAYVCVVCVVCVLCVCGPVFLRVSDAQNAQPAQLRPALYELRRR